MIYAHIILTIRTCIPKKDLRRIDRGPRYRGPRLDFSSTEFPSRSIRSITTPSTMTSKFSSTNFLTVRSSITTPSTTTSKFCLLLTCIYSQEQKSTNAYLISPM